jgi:hypothetical protein
MIEMGGGTDIEWYRKKYPDMIKICIFCLKEFVPRLAYKRPGNAITCSTECSNAYSHCSMKKRKLIKEKAAQFASSRSRGGKTTSGECRDPVNNEIEKKE